MIKLNKNRDLTTGSITGGLWSFAVPLMLGNVFQQFYNLADTWVVGKYVGDNALAAVGSSYTLLTFLNSVIIGLSLGTGAFVSMAFGRKRNDEIRGGIFMSSVFIGSLTLLITALIYIFIDPIITLLCVPNEIVGDIKSYLLWVFIGFFATFLYNYISNLLRAVGNSFLPLVFLAVSVVLNVGLDLYFVISLDMGIVNSFGTAVMAAFAVAVKIDTIAYMPLQDFGNAFSVFVAQNFGARKIDRIKSGIKQAVISVAIFSAVVSVIVFSLSGALMSIFVDGSNVQTIEIGSQYLQIEGACYIGIGILFMLYGYYRAVNKPFMSVVLTVLSLGTRVLLSLVLSGIPLIGVTGIWLSIPIGWFLADAFGVVYYLKKRNEVY